MAKTSAFVTGTARGIGRAIARRLAQDGFHVVGVDRDGDDNRASMAELKAEGLDVEGHGLDVTDRAAVAAALDRIENLGVVVNNAGVFWSRGFDDLTEDDFRKMMEINVVAVFIVSQEAARRMKPGSRIVNIASRAALGSPDYAHYVASKAAVAGLTKAMALDLRERQIAVNAVAPGLIESCLTKSALSPELQAKAMSVQPGGAMAQPDVIANAVSFLASPGTAFVNGQVLFVDGGKSVGALGL